MCHFIEQWNTQTRKGHQERGSEFEQKRHQEMYYIYNSTDDFLTVDSADSFLDSLWTSTFFGLDWIFHRISDKITKIGALSGWFSPNDRISRRVRVHLGDLGTLPTSKIAINQTRKKLQVILISRNWLTSYTKITCAGHIVPSRSSEFATSHLSNFLGPFIDTSFLVWIRRRHHFKGTLGDVGRCLQLPDQGRTLCIIY